MHSRSLLYYNHDYDNDNDRKDDYMSKFMQRGNGFFPTPGHTVSDQLPVGNYVVSQSMQGMYYEAAPKFDLPKKLYGNIEARAERIMTTFMDRPRATGVLFAGEKGSGKSQLARLLSVKGYELGMPTILVNAAWTGDPFNNLLADVEQPAIVLMDEFEKVYSKEEQQEVLTLLDGTMTTKKLFVLTVNNKYAVDQHMKNRPGRLFYNIEFTGLDTNFVREYCEDTLDNKDHIDGVVTISRLFEEFNFDILKALVEEMNRYSEDAFDAMELLNAKPLDESGTTKFQAQVWDEDGVLLTPEDPSDISNPLTNRNGAAAFYLNHPTKKDEDGDPEQQYVVVRKGEIVKLDAEKGVYEYQTEAGFRVLITKVEIPAISYRHLTPGYGYEYGA